MNAPCDICGFVDAGHTCCPPDAEIVLRLPRDAVALILGALAEHATCVAEEAEERDLPDGAPTPAELLGHSLKLSILSDTIRKAVVS